MNNWLVQEEDSPENSLYSIKWSVKTENLPTAKNCRELEFAWKMCKYVKSNAIVLACSKDGGIMLSGIGAGQTSRVDAVKIAISSAKTNPEECVMASDGFFPFSDGPVMAMNSGVKAFIQPGGSIRDQEVIDSVNQKNGIMKWPKSFPT